jgi:hypothetical protein
MNFDETLDLLRHVLLSLQPGIWYMVDDADEFYPTMHMAISLSIYLYQTLLLASGIMSRHGENIRFSLQKLDQIKVTYKRTLTSDIQGFFCK